MTGRDYATIRAALPPAWQQSRKDGSRGRGNTAVAGVNGWLVMINHRAPDQWECYAGPALVPGPLYSTPVYPSLAELLAAVAPVVQQIAGNLEGK